ncbi:MAG TPA: DUF5915 domain-containing protein, partial [Levilinea sp.]|nr:DUF5915 domain-containing protein [Levilinea sp.]
ELTKGVTQTAQQAHQVILWDAVGETEGTGIVHIAPGCGAEDFQLGRQYGLPLIAPLEDEGAFVDGFGWLSGMNVAEVTEPILGDLQRKGLLYRDALYTHRYPTCWRCKSELVFRLVDEWFISMGAVYDKPRKELTAEEKERSLRYQIMDVVEQIRWVPEFGFAREMDWLRNMHDWMISKKRYWGLALPVWVCAGCGHFEVVGDEVELQARAVQGWEVFAGHTPHRPFIDAVKLACPRCQGLMSRIADVGNPWLDAGVVSFSTLQYRSDRTYWEKWYPANWISESFPGQFRNWFYSLLAMATVIDRSPPFLENFGYATLVAEDGRPMHKSWGNSIEFNEAADRMGVDVMRWLYCNHKPENDLQFGYIRGDEARRQFLIPLWNAYSFFVTYANLDGWLPAAGSDFDPLFPEGETPRSESLLDRWVLARLNQVVERVTAEMEDSDFYGSASAVAVFIDDLTNWYVRRSRRRFWKSEHDSDKGSAYATLYHVLVKLARLLAPFTPFFTESIYQNLVVQVYPEALESVHHTRWPKCDSSAVDAALLEEMALSRQIASLGLGARNCAHLKVRQPLALAMVYAGRNQRLRAELVDIVTDELNVKAFEFVDEPRRLVRYRVLPDNKVLGPKFGAQLPKVRAALASSDPSVVAERVLAGLPVMLDVGGRRIELAPEEILVHTEPVAGLAVASEHGITVAIDANLTEELQSEGLAREVVRRIQAMRKEAGFNIDDRIHTYYQLGDKKDWFIGNLRGERQEWGLLAGEARQQPPHLAPTTAIPKEPKDILSGVMKKWSVFICAETLSVSLTEVVLPPDAYSEQHHIEGEAIQLAVRKMLP